jgi:FixJ family two-component response regulator
MNEMVYIAGDDETVGESMSSLLRANGKRVRIFPSGRESLDFKRQEGASDFLRKPVDEAERLAIIERTLELDRKSRKKALEHARPLARYQSLTPGEQLVLPMLVRGLINKQAGHHGVNGSDTRRTHYAKDGSDSFTRLVKLAIKLNLGPTNAS